MASTRKVLDQPKVHCHFSSICTAARDVLRAVGNLPTVSKVQVVDRALIGARQPRLDINPVPVGLQIIVHAPSERIKMYIHTKYPASVAEYISHAWDKLRRHSRRD